MGQSLPLAVTATWSDGRREDVTHLSRFQSNTEGLAAVDEAGVVTAGQSPGVAAVMASYLGSVDTLHVIIPRPRPKEPLPVVTQHNFIDGHVYRRLSQLNIAPAELCSDAEFLRRTSLDLIGTLPTAEEARKFLADTEPDKRTILVERLMERPEFADYWALKWSDLLRVERQSLGHKGAYDFYRWVRQSLAENRPLDLLAREIVTAEGPLDDVPPANFYSAVK